jgi:uncharacterized membrane protein
VSEISVKQEESPTLESALRALRERVVARATVSGTAARIVYASVAAYAVLFAIAAVMHYAVYRSANADLGHMVQAVWTTLHGHTLETTTMNGHQVNRLGIHVDPMLVLLVPIYAVWSSPLMLVALQAIAVASGALPVFWLARKHLASDRAGAHFAFAYLLYPATQFNAFTNTSSFHAVALAVPLILYAIWFLDEDRLVAFTITALLAATTKEEIPLAVGCLGIWYAVRKGRWLLGSSVFAAGLALTLLDFLWVIPHFSPSGVDPFVGRYSDVGTTPGGIVHKALTDPVAVVHAVLTGHKALYLVLLLAPFIGLWAFEPLLLLGAVPDLAINLLSSKTDQTSIPFHWTAGIIPFVVAASVFGAARFKRHGDRLSVYAMVGAGSIALFSPIYFLKGDLQSYPSALRHAKTEALALIPAETPVSASNQLGGHLAERRYIYSFPSIRRANWIVVDPRDPTYRDAKGYKRAIRRYEADKNWRRVFFSHGISVLQRRHGG